MKKLNNVQLLIQGIKGFKLPQGTVRVIAFSAIVVALLVGTIGVTLGFSRAHYAAWVIEYQYNYIDVLGIHRLCLEGIGDTCTETVLAMVMREVYQDGERPTQDDWQKAAVVQINSLYKLSKDTDSVLALIALPLDGNRAVQEVDCLPREYQDTQELDRFCDVWPATINLSHRIPWEGRFR